MQFLQDERLADVKMIIRYMILKLSHSVKWPVSAVDKCGSVLIFETDRRRFDSALILLLFFLHVNFVYFYYIIDRK